MRRGEPVPIGDGHVPCSFEFALTKPDPTPYPLDHLCVLHQEDGIALIVKQRSFTFGELNTGTGKMAAFLADALEPGERVATWAGKGIATSLMPLAAARAGVVHVPINPLVKRAQVAHILADSGARLLIANDARLQSLRPGDVPQDCALLSEGAFQGAWEQQAALPASSHDPERIAAILYTSGSTGKPKGVVLSHANLWLGAVSVAHYLRLQPDDATLAVLPFSFDYGQNQLLSTWYAGGAAYPLDYLVPHDVAKACERHAITTLAAIPPLWTQLVEYHWTEATLRSIRRVTNSGGALTSALVSRLRQTFPYANLYPMYGLTEAFRSTYLEPSLVDTHPTSMGRAIPFAEILVTRPDGSLAAPREPGELVHCGPLVAQGYWRDSARTAARFRQAPPSSRYGGTAVYSGDTVLRDEDGLLYFVGRDDAMIKTSGHRVSPEDIEEQAMDSGMLRSAIALGVPDEQIGQAIHLVIVPSGDWTAQREQEFRRFLTDRLPNFMQPRTLELRDRLPFTANGKIDRTALKEVRNL